MVGLRNDPVTTLNSATVPNLTLLPRAADGWGSACGSQAASVAVMTMQTALHLLMPVPQHAVMVSRVVTTVNV